jgi:hypothetical protein
MSPLLSPKTMALWVWAMSSVAGNVAEPRAT